MINKSSSLVAALVMLILFLWDFSGRIWLDDVGVSENKLTVSDGDWASAAVLSPQLYQQIVSLYDKYDVVIKVDEQVPEVENRAGMSLSDQNNQQGVLDQLYSGDEILTLKGTINVGTEYALLQQKNIKTDVTLIKKLEVGENLLGYTLKDISQKSALLVAANERQVDLVLYQIKANNKVQND